MRARATAAALAVLALVACSGAGEQARETASTASPSTSTSTSSTVPELPELPVREPVVWLCRPTTGGVDDAACTAGLDAVTVSAAGSAPDPFQRAAEPPVDCFYVYPTVSRAPETNAPKQPEPAVVAAVRAQAALFGEACRLFVPVYRQVTRAAIANGAFFDQDAQRLAQDDIRDAWHQYLNEDNAGRGVVLIGHSQGGMQLARLLQAEIATRPAVRERIVSALLIGASVSVGEGANAERDVADQAGSLPACREAGQVGCVVAYSSFADVPPPGALFARAGQGRRMLCTDPTVLSGRPGQLLPYLPTDRLGPDGALTGAVPAPDGVAGFVAYPGAGTAECRSEGDASWLQVGRAPGVPAPPVLESGDGGLGPAWGLHVADVNLALGNLVEVVRLQGQAWEGR